jgi:hypothetical protein
VGCLSLASVMCCQVEFSATCRSVVERSPTDCVCVCVCVIAYDRCTNSGPGYYSRYGDSLRAGRSGDRIPVGARFSTPVQTGPGAHPVFCTMGTGSPSREKKLPGRGVDHPHPSNAEVKERAELHLSSSSGPSWPVLG